MSQQLSHYEESENKMFKINSNPRKYYELQKSKNADITEEFIENKKEELKDEIERDPNFQFDIKNASLIKNVPSYNSIIYPNTVSKMNNQNENNRGQSVNERYSPSRLLMSENFKNINNPQISSNSHIRKNPIPPQKIAFRYV